MIMERTNYREIVVLHFMNIYNVKAMLVSLVIFLKQFCYFYIIFTISNGPLMRSQMYAAASSVDNMN